MRAVVQRVSSASVDVHDLEAEPRTAEAGGRGRVERVAKIESGLVALVGVGHRDTEKDAQDLARKLAGLRIFEDEAGKMNRSVQDVGGSLLLVSQFTLLADVRRGRRPSFGDAASPEVAEPLFEALVQEAKAQGVPVVTGRFRTKMSVALVNDGPVTILLDTEQVF